MRYIPVLIAILVLCLPTAAAQGTMILVSDNRADCAVAEALEAENSATIVKTTWGTFEQEVLDTIVDAAPTEVIIIGGPMAVVEEYEADLEASMVNVTRIWGNTRQQTSLRVFNHYRARYNWSAMVGDGTQPYRPGIGCPVWFYDNETEIEDLIRDRGAAVMNYGMAARFADIHGAPTVNVTSAQVSNFGEQIRLRIRDRYGNHTWVRARMGDGPLGYGGMGMMGR